MPSQPLIEPARSLRSAPIDIGLETPQFVTPWKNGARFLQALATRMFGYFFILNVLLVWSPWASFRVALNS